MRSSNSLAVRDERANRVLASVRCINILVPVGLLPLLQSVQAIALSLIHRCDVTDIILSGDELRIIQSVL